MNSRFTLVPSELFSEEAAREILSKVALLEDGEPLSFQDVPSFDAVLIYAGEKRPGIYDILMSLCKIRDYNKILVSVEDGWMYVAVSQGDSLLLCNSFKALDEVTIQYYIFMLLKKFQINPEQTTVYFLDSLSNEMQLSLCQFVKSAEVLQ